MFNVKNMLIGDLKYSCFEVNLLEGELWPTAVTFTK